MRARGNICFPFGWSRILSNSDASTFDAQNRKIVRIGSRGNLLWGAKAALHRSTRVTTPSRALLARSNANSTSRSWSSCSTMGRYSLNSAISSFDKRVFGRPLKETIQVHAIHHSGSDINSDSQSQRFKGDSLGDSAMIQVRLNRVNHP
jgi:hypothetical protein